MSGICEIDERGKRKTCKSLLQLPSSKAQQQGTSRDQNLPVPGSTGGKINYLSKRPGKRGFCSSPAEPSTAGASTYSTGS